MIEKKISDYLESRDENKINEAVGVFLHIFESLHDRSAIILADLIWQGDFKGIEVDEKLVEKLLILLRNFLTTPIGDFHRSEVLGIFGKSQQFGLIEYLSDSLQNEIVRADSQIDSVHQILVSLDYLGCNTLKEVGSVFGLEKIYDNAVSFLKDQDIDININKLEYFRNRLKGEGASFNNREAFKSHLEVIVKSLEP